jgi:hypothetical protein
MSVLSVRSFQSGAAARVVGSEYETSTGGIQEEPRGSA